MKLLLSLTAEGKTGQKEGNAVSVFQAAATSAWQEVRPACDIQEQLHVLEEPYTISTLDPTTESS